jgi:hypothetical protein
LFLAVFFTIFGHQNSDYDVTGNAGYGSGLNKSGSATLADRNHSSYSEGEFPLLTSLLEE